MRKPTQLLSIVLLLSVISSSLLAHCQVPCGIYGDKMRFDMLSEHITTIEKSMNQINELSGDAAKNMNQLVRWVNNKDNHADEFTEIVTYYFLAQRIKVTEKNDAAFADYQNKVTTLHQMMVYSMKCKQTTDLENVNKLKALVDEFEGMYFSEEDLKHLKDHK
jgi:nickel superoxide dismutase